MCCKAKASCLRTNQRTWTYNKQVGGWLGKVSKRIQNLSAAKSRANICLTGCSKKNCPSRSGMTTQWHSALPSSPARVTVHSLRQQHQTGESIEITGRKSTTRAGNCTQLAKPQVKPIQSEARVRVHTCKFSLSSDLTLPLGFPHP